MQFLTSQSYARRTVPTPANNLVAWAGQIAAFLGLEFATVQRSLTRASSRIVTHGSSAADKMATVTDGLIVCDASGGAFGITIPAAADVPDTVLTILRINSGLNAVTVTGTVNGSANPALALQYASMTIWAVAPPGVAAVWLKIAST